MMKSHVESHRAYSKIARAQILNINLQNLIISLVDVELSHIFVMKMLQFQFQLGKYNVYFDFLSADMHN